MTDRVPLVVYREVEGKTERIVIGECEVSEDGILEGEITNDADEHTFKAILGNGGKFKADISGYAPDAKWTMRQNKEDGMPRG